MPLVINTNVLSDKTISILNAKNDELSSTMERLASGNRITKPSDDAGGLAVSSKMTAAQKRNRAVGDNIENALSFLQTQDGGLETTQKILERVSELKVLASDQTKSQEDKDNYQTEFKALITQVNNVIVGETFNNVGLFGTTTRDVLITENGQKVVSLIACGLTTAVTSVFTAISTLASLNITAITSAIQNVATLRAQNGATSSRLSFALSMLDINNTNLGAANSRIKDTDIAETSKELAQVSILQQAAAAMLAQANAAPRVALSLLQ